MHRLSQLTRRRTQAPTSGHDEDRRLMQLVAQGDPRARQLCAMRLVVRIRRVATAVLGHSADVDDVIQESILAIFAAAGGFRGESRLERWAERITARTSIAWARKRQRHRSRMTSHDDAHAHELNGESAPDDSGSRWARTAAAIEADEELPRPLRAYLDALPPVERAALVLRHALGHTLGEIAELTDSSESTVKYRIRNALNRARAHIRRDALCASSQANSGRPQS